ncbi:MAG: Gfo/Idh/MocA family oxidoreductase [Nitratireductor sp.]|nr:Gfo/Idh/MocA family oxidoreductase [Nitratireductor sp.]
MTGQLAVAVAGLGYFSQFHLASWQKIDETALVGLFDADPARLAQAAERTGAPGFATLAAMLDAGKPDILDIVTPPHTHAGFIEAAAREGLTIICQKPFCTSVQEAHRVAKLAGERGALLIIHENIRFQPWYRRIAGLLASDTIGQVYQAHFRLRPGDGQGKDAYLDRQPAFQTMPRLLVHETGVHFIDLFRWLFGDITHVYSDCRRLNPAIAGEDAGFVILDHECGVTTVFDGNRLADHRAENRRKTLGEMVIEGSAGTIRLDGSGRVFVRSFNANEEREIPFDYVDEGFGGGCVEALNRHVVAHLLHGAPLENRADDYLPVIAIVERAYQSWKQGRKLETGADHDRQ